jgi:hypothetical protein
LLLVCSCGSNMLHSDCVPRVGSQSGGGYGPLSVPFDMAIVRR